MTNSRGRVVFFFAASYAFLFTILPSARSGPTFVASCLAFGVAIHFIRRFDDARARLAAFWALVLAGGIAWSFDNELARRFDPLTGLLGMFGWGACALAAASPEVLVETARRGARRLRGLGLAVAGVLAILVHLGAWFARGQESRLLAHALATVAALCLAVVLAAQSKTRRVLAAACALLAVGWLFVSI
jgi:hypothetical protein